MTHFNLNRIINEYQPNTDELGKVLFPYIKYPKQAFDRVLRGEANLDVAQVEALASYLGVFPQDLFKMDGWSQKWDSDDKCLTFIKGDYRVNLNYNGSYVTVYRNNEMIYQEIKANADSMTVEDFINYINQIVNGTN